MFSRFFLAVAVWALKQSLGTKRGTAAVAHAAPVLATVADAAQSAAVVQIGKAAATGGDIGKVVDLVKNAQLSGLITGQDTQSPGGNP